MSLKEFSAGFHLYGEALSTLINTLLLTIVYILGIGGAALLARLSGKRFLAARGWQSRQTKKQPLAAYYRQF